MKAYNIRKIRLKETDSTNHYAATLPVPGNEDMVIVIAENQTAGKGQGGTFWESEKGKNLTFSIMCAPQFLKPKMQFAILQAQSLALYDVVSAIVDGVSIKWPNDIYINDKKVSGTLSECQLESGKIVRAIIGTGLNVNQRLFMSDAPNPTSLSLEAGWDMDRESVLDDIIIRFVDYYNMLRDGFDISDIYFKALYRRVGVYPYRDKFGRFSASIKKVEPDGQLILCDDSNNERSYCFKEVEFLQ